MLANAFLLFMLFKGVEFESEWKCYTLTLYHLNYIQTGALRIWFEENCFRFQNFLVSFSFNSRFFLRSLFFFQKEIQPKNF